eukprot:4452847-Karenia_brevis.AAC.1
MHNRCAILCGQEHKLAGEALHTVQGVMSSTGWAVSAAEAVKTQETEDQRFRSAGTMVAVPTWIGSEALWPFGVADLSPLGAEGRLAARW